MQPIDWRDYVISDPTVLAAKPHLKDTRLSIEFVFELLAGGWDHDAIRDNYPNLTEDRIRAALAYAAETFREERFYVLPPAGKGDQVGTSDAAAVPGQSSSQSGAWSLMMRVIS